MCYSTYVDFPITNPRAAKAAFANWQASKEASKQASKQTSKAASQQVSKSASIDDFECGSILRRFVAPGVVIH